MIYKYTYNKKIKINISPKISKYFLKFLAIRIPYLLKINDTIKNLNPLLTIEVRININKLISKKPAVSVKIL